MRVLGEVLFVKLKSRQLWLLLLIFCVGLLLRLYRLDENLPSLYSDEVGHLWYLERLHEFELFNPETWANSLYSLFFTATWWHGLTPLGVRLPAAVWGSLIPLSVYFLVSSLHFQTLNKQTIALVSAALSAFAPWSYMISRIGHTHIPMVVVLSCLSVGWYFQKKYLQSLFLLTLAAYIYPSLIVMSPFLLVVMYLGIDKKDRKNVLISVGGVGLLMLAILFFKYGGLSLASRGVDLAIWRDVNVTADSNLYRGISRSSEPTIFSFNQSPELGNRLVYNYPVSVLRKFRENYLYFFSPKWLFLEGDPVLRHSTGQVGVLYLWMLPFVVVGGYRLAKGRLGLRVRKDGFLRASQTSHSLRSFQDDKADYKSLLALPIFGVWILASPIPAAITHDGAGYLLRAVTMLPFVTILGAIGVVDVYQKWGIHLLNKVVYVFAVLLVASYSLYYFLFGYFHVYPALAAESYEYGFKELVEWHDNNDGKMLILWDGYYPVSYFKFWNYTSDNLDIGFNELNREIIIDTTIFYQRGKELYFGYPKNIDVLREFLKEEDVEYLAFSNKTINEYPLWLAKLGEVVQRISYGDDYLFFVIVKVVL